MKRFATMHNQEEDTPQEGDWVTEDHVTFTQHTYSYRHRLIVPEGQDWREALNARMAEDQFFPNVWLVSDHGNWILLSMEESK